MKRPDEVEAMVRKLRRLHPDAKIEAEPVWFVRAVKPIPTSNVGHELCVDARTVKVKS